MSLALETGQTLRGVAGSATSITYTVMGDEVSGGTDAFKVLAQGQLPAVIGTLYTVPASTQAIIKTIHLANPTGSAVTAKLAIGGTADANVILPPISIMAGGFAIYADDGWRAYDNQGRLRTVGDVGPTGSTGPSGPQGIPGPPGIDGSGEDVIESVMLGLPNHTHPSSGSGTIQYNAQTLASSFTAIANTSYTDILSFSLSAGTYLVMAQVQIQTNVGDRSVTIKLWDGSSAAYSSAELAVVASASNTALVESSQTIFAIITLASTTTVKLSAKGNEVSQDAIIRHQTPTFTEAACTKLISLLLAG